MRYKLFTFLFLACLCISCSEDEESILPLEGYYSLFNVTCDCAPINVVPHQTQIEWDEADGILRVRTFFEDQETTGFLPEGDYAITYDNGIMNVNGRFFSVSSFQNSLIFNTSSPFGTLTLPSYVFVMNQ